MEAPPLCRIGRFRLYWAVENLFDPSWTQAKTIPAEEDARLDNRDERMEPSAGHKTSHFASDKLTNDSAQPSTVIHSPPSFDDPNVPEGSAASERELGGAHRGSGNSCGRTSGGTASGRCVHISLEYVLLVSFALWVIGYGWAALDRESREHRLELGFPTIVRYPRRLFVWLLNAKGMDDGVDRQWLAYEFFCPILACLSGLVAFVTRRIRSRQAAAETVGPLSMDTQSEAYAGKESGTAPRGVPRLWQRKNLLAEFYALLGLLFVLVAHHAHVIFPLFIVTANFLLFSRLVRWRRCPYTLYLSLTWIAHVGVMYLNEYYQGYEFLYWVQYFLPTEAAGEVLGTEYAPVVPRLMRWHITYRMYVLRMIAFNYDMWEANRSAAATRERALSKHLNSCVECAKLRERLGAAAEPPHALLATVTSSESRNGVKEPPGGGTDAEVQVPILRHTSQGPLPALTSSSGAFSGATGASEEASGSGGPDQTLWCYKLRTEYPRDSGDYNYATYLAYLLFCPLYVAGPITSFNAFASHLRAPSHAMTRRDAWMYLLRILFTYFVMQVLQHTVYLTAFGERALLVQNMPAVHQAYYLYFYLAYLYLKFNFIWKTSRFFAIWSGIEVPENLLRCFSNSCFTRDFWRCWHASFNLWIVRYMYIPMGGRKHMLVSIFPIFFFIAIWHDHALHLLKWAALIILIFVAEVLVGRAYGQLSNVFSREMARCGEGNTTASTRTRAAVPSTLSSPESPPVPRGADAGGGCLRAVARFTATHTTPRQRCYLERVLTAWGGALAVAAQIVANIVGYSIQRDYTKTAGSMMQEATENDADGTIVRTLRMAHDNGLACVMAACFLYTIATSGTLSKKRDGLREKLEKKRYGLK